MTRNYFYVGCPFSAIVQHMWQFREWLLSCHFMHVFFIPISPLHSFLILGVVNIKVDLCYPIFFILFLSEAHTANMLTF